MQRDSSYRATDKIEMEAETNDRINAFLERTAAAYRASRPDENWNRLPPVEDDGYITVYPEVG